MLVALRFEAAGGSYLPAASREIPLAAFETNTARVGPGRGAPSPDRSNSRMVVLNSNDVVVWYRETVTVGERPFPKELVQRSPSLSNLKTMVSIQRLVLKEIRDELPRTIAVLTNLGEAIVPITPSISLARRAQGLGLVSLRDVKATWNDTQPLGGPSDFVLETFGLRRDQGVLLLESTGRVSGVCPFSKSDWFVPDGVSLLDSGTNRVLITGHFRDEYRWRGLLPNPDPDGYVKPATMIWDGQKSLGLQRVEESGRFNAVHLAIRGDGAGRIHAAWVRRTFTTPDRLAYSCGDGVGPWGKPVLLAGVPRNWLAGVAVAPVSGACYVMWAEDGEGFFGCVAGSTGAKDAEVIGKWDGFDTIGRPGNEAGFDLAESADGSLCAVWVLNKTIGEPGKNGSFHRLSLRMRSKEGWQSTQLVSEGPDQLRAPRARFDKFGNLHLVYVRAASSGPGHYFYRRLDATALHER